MDFNMPNRRNQNIKAVFQVLGTGSDGSGPSVILSIERMNLHSAEGETTIMKRYLFNCGEGTTRFCGEHKIKLSKLSWVVLMHLVPRCSGGFPGLVFSLSDMGRRDLKVFGPPGSKEFNDSVRTFVCRRFPEVSLVEVPCDDDSYVFEDENIELVCSVVTPVAQMTDHKHQTESESEGSDSVDSESQASSTDGSDSENSSEESSMRSTPNKKLKLWPSDTPKGKMEELFFDDMLCCEIRKREKTLNNSDTDDTSSGEGGIVYFSSDADGCSEDYSSEDGTTLDVTKHPSSHLQTQISGVNGIKYFSKGGSKDHTKSQTGSRAHISGVNGIRYSSKGGSKDHTKIQTSSKAQTPGVNEIKYFSKSGSKDNTKTQTGSKPQISEKTNLSSPYRHQALEVSFPDTNAKHNDIKGRAEAVLATIRSQVQNSSKSNSCNLKPEQTSSSDDGSSDDGILLFDSDSKSEDLNPNLEDGREQYHIKCHENGFVTLKPHHSNEKGTPSSEAMNLETKQTVPQEMEVSIKELAENSRAGPNLLQKFLPDLPEVFAEEPQRPQESCLQSNLERGPVLLCCIRLKGGEESCAIVLSCPTIQYIEALRKHPLLNGGFGRSKKTSDKDGIIFHFTPGEVLQHPSYQRLFLNGWEHSIVNGSKGGVLHRSTTVDMLKHNVLCPWMFPLPKGLGIGALENPMEQALGQGEDNKAGSKNKITLSLSRWISLPAYQKGWDPRPWPPLTEFGDEEYESKLAKRRRPLNIQEILQEVADKLHEKRLIDQWRKMKLSPCNQADKGGSKHHIGVRGVFLGTGCAAPSKHRASSGILLSVERCQKISKKISLLLDAGEGVVGQLQRIFGALKASEIIANLDVVWISHRHGDHHCGLSSLLAELWKYHSRRQGKSMPVLVIAPQVVLNHLRTCLKLIGVWQIQPLPFLLVSIQDFGAANCPVRNHFFAAFGNIFSNFVSVPVIHCPDAFGIVMTLVTGEKLVYSGDTRPCRALIEAGQGARLLIHEATFDDELTEDARKKRHCTIREALEVAAQMKAQLLVLTHFSQRYPCFPVLPEDSVFSNIGVIFSFDSLVFDIDSVKCSKITELNSLLNCWYQVESEIKDEMILNTNIC